jgi:hypothetical protein
VTFSTESLPKVVLSTAGQEIFVVSPQLFVVCQSPPADGFSLSSRRLRLFIARERERRGKARHEKHRAVRKSSLPCASFPKRHPTVNTYAPSSKRLTVCPCRILPKTCKMLIRHTRIVSVKAVQVLLMRFYQAQRVLRWNGLYRVYSRP